MWFKNLKIFFIIIFFLTSCAKDNQKNSIINEKSLDLQVLEAYEEGKKQLEAGDALFAAKKFNEAELLFPQSEWAPKSALMAAYSYYTQDFYENTIAELKRFLRIYPKHKNVDYAYYLLGLSYYEQIVDEKKDLSSIMNAKNTFEYIISEFPNTEYAMDSEFKIELINDIIASKEIYIGRYYQSKKKWIAAINRYRTIVDYYNTTIYIEEALHRLVEIYYIIGLENEASKYAQLLGYNYQSSKWYQQSYKIFDKNYKIQRKKLEKKKNSYFEKIKSLLDLDE